MNKHYTVYQSSTGEIDATGTTPDTMFHLQCDPGQLILEGTYDGNMYWIDQGFPTLRPVRPEFPAEGEAPLVIDLSWRAEGAMIQVTNQDGDSMIVADDSLELVDPGRYYLQVNQPFPQHSLNQWVIVNG